MSLDQESLARRHSKTPEDLQVDPTDLSENNSLYDEDEKQLVSPPP
jgi:hypothetical protein